MKTLHIHKYRKLSAKVNTTPFTVHILFHTLAVIRHAHLNAGKVMLPATNMPIKMNVLRIVRKTHNMYSKTPV